MKLSSGQAKSFEEMTTLPKDLRATLQEKACISHMVRIEVQESMDGTKKYLFKLEDEHVIESVLIPERDHDTLCISSQAGAVPWIAVSALPPNRALSVT